MMSAMHKQKEKNKSTKKKDTSHLACDLYTSLWWNQQSTKNKKLAARNEMKCLGDMSVRWVAPCTTTRLGFCEGFGSEATHRRKLARACWWQSVRRLKWFFFCLLSLVFILISAGELRREERWDQKTYDTTWQADNSVILRGCKDFPSVSHSCRCFAWWPWRLWHGDPAGWSGSRIWGCWSCSPTWRRSPSRPSLPTSASARGRRGRRSSFTREIPKHFQECDTGPWQEH